MELKFKGRNDGIAVEIRNHIVLFRIFAVTLAVCLVPAIIFLCIGNPYFFLFLILPGFCLVLSFAVLLAIPYDEKVFLNGAKKDHVFEISNDCIFKDKKEIKLVKSIKIYRYKRFLYMETSHSMFVIKDTDYVVGSRNEFLSWAKKNGIPVLFGY